jgi:hypothetical protein
MFCPILGYQICRAGLFGRVAQLGAGTQYMRGHCETRDGRYLFFRCAFRRGVVLTTDKGDLLKPEDIADAIHFALTRTRSPALDEVTIRPYWQER